MNSTDDKDETPQSKAADVADEHAERVASAAVVSPISSNPIELSPASFGPTENAPPSTVIENAMTRGRAPLPISTIVGIGCGVLVVLIGLSLLLFR